MRKILPLIAFLIILTLATPQICLANKEDLPDYIRNQLHNDISYTIITERNLNQLDKMDNCPQHHFLVVQIPPQNFQQEHADKIMAWVKKGHIAWYYDSRLAPFFQMENSPLNKDKIKGKAHNGDYGTKKVSGMNVVAYAYDFAEHPVATGVQSVQVFLMEVGKDEYSAVADNTPGVVPILRANVDEHKAVVALKEVGGGWIIFKPLLWPDVLGGERFQCNLMEFSAGYPVPKAERGILAPELLRGSSKMARYDSIILSDGQHFIGMLMDKELQILGPEGNSEKIEISRIKSINFDSTGSRFEMTDGTTFTGMLMAMSLRIQTPSGKATYIDKEDIIRIRFNVAQQ